MMLDYYEEFGLDPALCEFCGKGEDGRPVRHAIDGAWAHAECLEADREDEA